ncbi:TPX2 domain-containing protein [Heracleum sosnowskyi]|uniref:TPX2 domain-containing protein n=1 Tax=Heracleum sosnowskyi TaxID=360622 RepID=A0AAD8LVS7_9APIA|nr:TPX2 domain-containing protein [Heracleum sosnowskyi]
MSSTGKNSDSVTPVKSNRSKLAEIPKKSENSNPNLTTPNAKPSANKSVKKSPKSVRKSPNLVNTKIRERRFVVAKKISKKSTSSSVSCKCLISGKSKKCACVAYESLKASQEGFFRNLKSVRDCDKDENQIREEEEEEEAINSIDRDVNLDESEVIGETGSATLKRRRDKLLEEARRSVPESGRVMHLVKAFEKLLSIQKLKDFDKEDDKEGEDAKKGVKWALPGLQSDKVPETQVSASSLCPSDLLLTSESLGLDSLVGSSLDGSQGSFIVSNRTPGAGRRSRRNSLDSSVRLGERNWRRRQRKVTSQKPFILRTEERGRSKEEEFIRKVQEKKIEEEKQRIPIAQGLPRTTDQPEHLAKPPVKESTKPVDVVLHSDVRAVERAEFDHQVAEKMSLIEQYRMEMERQLKLEEEEEIRRLRKELVPKAQPMPYFDRPFIPRRSEKPPTIPKEPRFHLPQHKKIKSCLSWNAMYTPHQGGVL